MSLAVLESESERAREQESKRERERERERERDRRRNTFETIKRKLTVVAGPQTYPQGLRRCTRES